MMGRGEEKAWATAIENALCPSMRMLAPCHRRQQSIPVSTPPAESREAVLGPLPTRGLAGASPDLGQALHHPTLLLAVSLCYALQEDTWSFAALQMCSWPPRPALQEAVCCFAAL